MPSITRLCYHTSTWYPHNKGSRALSLSLTSGPADCRTLLNGHMVEVGGLWSATARGKRNFRPTGLRLPPIRLMSRSVLLLSLLLLWLFCLCCCCTSTNSCLLRILIVHVEVRQKVTAAAPAPATAVVEGGYILRAETTLRSGIKHRESWPENPNVAHAGPLQRLRAKGINAVAEPEGQLACSVARPCVQPAHPAGNFS